MSRVVVELDNVTVGYDYHPAVHHVSGFLREGRIIALMGPNGGGKSSFLRAIKGQVSLLGGNIKTGFSNSSIGYLTQKSSIRGNCPLRVREVVTLGLFRKFAWWKGLGGSNQKNVLDALTSMNLEDVRDEFVDRLSEGQFCRTLIARLVVGDFKINLLDEPFDSLDKMGIESLKNLLIKWRDQGKTVVVSLHSYEIAREIADELIIIARELKYWGDTEQGLEEWEKISDVRMVKNQVVDWCEKE